MTADAEALKSMIGEYVELYQAVLVTRQRMNELKADIIMLARSTYPDAWHSAVDTQETPLVLTHLEDGTKVEIPVSRAYDPDKIRATFGEDDPELVRDSITVTEWVNGAKFTKFWKRADTRDAIAECLLPAGSPTLRVTRPRGVK